MPGEIAPELFQGAMRSLPRRFFADAQQRRRLGAGFVFIETQGQQFPVGGAQARHGGFQMRRKLMP